MSFLRFKKACAIFFGTCLLLAGAAWAQQKAAEKQQKAAPKQEKVVRQKDEQGEKDEKGEVRLEVKDLPKAVQATMKRETVGAEIIGLSKETEAGKTLYEVETKVNGYTRDILINAKGALTEVEAEVALTSLPAAVQAEVKKSIGKAKLVKIESVANGSKVLTGYSALVETAGKQSEVEMGLDGKLLAKGK